MIRTYDIWHKTIVQRLFKLYQLSICVLYGPASDWCLRAVWRLPPSERRRAWPGRCLSRYPPLHLEGFLLVGSHQPDISISLSRWKVYSICMVTSGLLIIVASVTSSRVSRSPSSVSTKVSSLHYTRLNFFRIPQYYDGADLTSASMLTCMTASKPSSSLQW